MLEDGTPEGCVNRNVFGTYLHGLFDSGELTGALLASPHVQGYCYTQLTDVGTEKNGLLTENREPKIPLQRLRILNDGK